MTKVRALKTKKYAKTDDIQPLLTLDAYGQINVIVVDNLDHCLDSLKLRKNKQLKVADIINANIVFSLARQLNLDIGIYREADAVIWDYIKSNISHNIIPDDIELLMQELKESWQRLHQHPLAKRYIPLANYQPIDYFLTQPPFAGFGGYDLFIKDYLYELSRVCFDQYGQIPSGFCVIIDLLYRSLYGLNYFPNTFLQQENVIACLKWHKEPQANPSLLRHSVDLQAAFDKLKAQWFVIVLGTVKLDLDEFEIDHPREAGVALARLIDEGTCVSEDEDVKQQLFSLLQYLSTNSEPLQTFMKSSRFDETLYSKDQGIEIFQDAIRYAIAYYAKLRCFMLKPFMAVPIYFWAGKGLNHEEKLVAHLEDTNNRQLLKDFEIKALSKYSEHKIVQAYIETEMARRQSLAHFSHYFSLMSMGGPYMPGTVLNIPRPALLYRPPVGALQIRPAQVMPPQNDPIFDETVPDDENILSLKEPSSCTMM